MPVLRDLIGERFGHWTVIERAASKGKHARCRCRCDCGNTRVVLAGNLLRGLTRSCGCRNGQRIEGLRFGRLVAIERVQSKEKNAQLKCRCDCGNLTIVPLNRLRNGGSRSCGCLMRELATIRATTHGHTPKGHQPVEYRCWQSMKSRCLYPRNASFAYYGGRGIKVCDRWLNSFKNFLADMGRKPSPQHSIDRINPLLGYFPANCRWSTAKEQANNRRNNKRAA